MPKHYLVLIMTATSTSDHKAVPLKACLTSSKDADVSMRRAETKLQADWSLQLVPCDKAEIWVHETKEASQTFVVGTADQ